MWAVATALAAMSSACVDANRAGSGGTGELPMLDETGAVPSQPGEAALASVRAWARGRPADDARVLELARTHVKRADPRATITLPRAPHVDATSEGGAIYVLLRRDAIYVATVDAGLNPRGWRKIVALGPRGMPPASAMRSVLIEPLRLAIDAHWRAATRLSMAARAESRIWVAVLADADVRYKTFLALFATADTVGVADVRFLVQGPAGLGSVRLRAALDVPERGTVATPRIFVGPRDVAIDPGAISCASGARPCVVVAHAAFTPADCARAGIASGEARDFVMLGGDVEAPLAELTRALSTCRAARGSRIVDVPVRLTGDPGATGDCRDSRIQCAQ